MVKDITKETKTSNEAEVGGVSAAQFAVEIGVSFDRLLTQLHEAGIVGIKATTDIIYEKDKQTLLSHLNRRHGKPTNQVAQEVSPGKIVLRRTRVSEMKVGGTHGAAKTKTLVQVRKSRTYVKRQVMEETQAPEETPVEEIHISPDEVVSTQTAASEHIIETSAAAPLPEEAVSAESQAAVTESPAVALTAEEKEDALRAGKRKEKSQEEDFEEQERQKKKKKTKEGNRFGDEKKFEALLSRGADLSRVFKQQDEDDGGDNALRRGKSRAHIQSKIKVQAFKRPAAPMIKEVPVPEKITIGELAQKMAVKATEVIKTLMKMGTIATINQEIDQDTALLVIEEMGHVGKPVRSDAIEVALSASDQEGEALPRPPVITIMGHVDHGKTTLLDYIRTAKVAASEAGGITQHIGAYHVTTPKGMITFLDTPGHAAFTAMRARGAKLTDIVILVVAADDGVMPQTVEAIQHAKAANVPIVVAVNKMDKHGVDPDRIKTELSKHGLIAEDWGGDAMFLPLSAKTGMGVDQLLDSILVQAEMLELKAVASGRARGVVIESRLDRGRGAVMSVLVQSGALSKGDIILAGLEYGRVRALFDERGQPIQSAGPSMPVEVLGLSGVSQAGDDFIVVTDEHQAREVALYRQNKHREAKFTRQAPSMDDMLKRMQEGQADVKVVNVLIKADVQGSVEALRQSLTDLSTTEVKLNVISSGIGGINESDVNLAVASSAVLIGFNVRANADARKLIESNGVEVQYHNIIYDVINQIKKAMSGVLAPIVQEKLLGMAEVREVFRSSKTGAVAGCMVTEGIIKRNFPIRVLRDHVVIFEGALESLRRFKEDVGEVRNGMECGIAVKNYNDIKPGDQIEVFERTEVKREI